MVRSELCRKVISLWSRLILYLDNGPIRRKNRNINANIRKCVLVEGQTLPPREATLNPEILIPCFNQGRYLEDALSSVIDSSVLITVIDDASTDDTELYIQCLLEKS